MEKKRLGDICEIVTGATPKTNIKEFWDGDINWITPAELTEDTYIINESLRKITTDYQIQRLLYLVIFVWLVKEDVKGYKSYTKLSPI